MVQFCRVKLFNVQPGTELVVRIREQCFTDKNDPLLLLLFR